MPTYKGKVLVTFEKEYLIEDTDPDYANDHIFDLVSDDLESIGVDPDDGSSEAIVSLELIFDDSVHYKICTPAKPRTLKTTNIHNNTTEENYYLHNDIMAIDIMDLVCDYYEGELPTRDCVKLWTALKYLLRFPFKGQRNSDLDKAIEYIKALEE